MRMPARFGAERGAPVLEAAATIRSDFECATLLVEFMEAQTPEGPFAAPFFAAVGTLGSDFERGRVLKSVVRRQPLSPEVLTRLFEAVVSMQSDFEQAEVLLAVLKLRANRCRRERFLHRRGRHDSLRLRAGPRICGAGSRRTPVM